jgi:UDP-3-O-[3-hydroxymyristoyl] N-acetylglucosamine deacetylase
VPATQFKTPQDPTNSLTQPKKLNAPVWVRQDDACVVALPSRELRFSYAIDFDLPAIGRQWYSWSPVPVRVPQASRVRGQEGFGESFIAEIAPARTFGLAHQIDQLRAAGLIKGGSLENALVCGPSGWRNPPLRFANEPVRHKILDLVGDLSLLGTIPQAHYLAYKASHNLHVQLAKAISSQLLAQPEQV